MLGVFLSPVRGVVWLAETLRDEAERRLKDPAAVRRRLEELDAAHKRGEITEKQVTQGQEAVLAPLMEAPLMGTPRTDGTPP